MELGYRKGWSGRAGLLGLTFNVWLWFLHLQIGYTDWDGRDLGGPGPPRVLPLWGPSKLASSMACPSPTADLRCWSILHGHHVHLVGPGLSYLSELCSQLACRSLPCPRGSGLHVRGWERRLEYEADPSPCPRPLPPPPAPCCTGRRPGLLMVSLTESALALDLDLEFSFANGLRLLSSAFTPEPPAHGCIFLK